MLCFMKRFYYIYNTENRMQNKDMASYVTSLVLFFALIGEITSSCVGTGEDNVVPVCTDCSKTGREVLIDTSMVPRNANVICICNIAASTKTTNFTVAYHGPNYTEIVCIIAFEFMSYKFPCEMNGSVSVEALSVIHFRKDHSGNSPPANLSISADQANATVTVVCRSMLEQSITMSAPLPVTTDSPFSQSALQPLPAESSSMRTSIYTTAATQTTLKTPYVPVNETILPRSKELGSNEDNHTVITAGACGGAGGMLLLLLVTLLLLYLYRSRVQKPSTDSPPKIAQFNSASDLEVTENVVYNMEFADETKYAHEPLSESDVTCNSVHNDIHLQKPSNATNTIVTYQNPKVHNNNETFDTNNFVPEYQNYNKPTVIHLKKMQLDINNTVDLEDTTKAQTKQYSNTQYPSDIDDDPFSDTVGQNHKANISVKINDSISAENQVPEATYAVVNKYRFYDMGIERPKQFQVPESGDTYALVNKESVQ